MRDSMMKEEGDVKAKTGTETGRNGGKDLEGNIRPFELYRNGSSDYSLPFRYRLNGVFRRPGSWNGIAPTINNLTTLAPVECAVNFFFSACMSC